MCKRKSGEVVLIGDKIRVFTLKCNDSHTDIRQEHNIPEDEGPTPTIKGSLQHTPVELIAVNSLIELSGMEFHFDDKRPDWWMDDMTEEATRQLFQVAKKDWRGKILEYKGSLDLCNLTKLEPGATLTAGGGLDLRNLTKLEPGVTLTAGGNLYLRNLTKLEPGVTLTAGGNLYLCSLTKLRKDTKVTAKKVFLK